MRILAWIAGIAAALVIVLIGVVFLMDWNSLRGFAEDTASTFLGRPVAIGELRVDPGWTTRVEISNLRIANPDWASDPALADIASLRFAIRVWPLIGGTLDVPAARVTGASLNLERDAEGRTTWDFPALAAEAVEPDDRDDLPVFGELRILDSTLRYTDALRDIALEGTVEIATADGSTDQAVNVGLAGTMSGDAIEIQFIGGSLALLRQGDAAYPISLSAELGATEFSAEGTVQDPAALSGIDAQMTLAGPNLAELLPSLKLPLPATPPYELNGRVVRDGQIWNATIDDGRLGESDVAGDLVVDLGGEKPSVRGKLISNRLEFADLAPLIGLPPPDSAKAEPDQAVKAEPAKKSDQNDQVRASLFPTETLDPARFHNANVDIDITVKEVRAPAAIPVTAIATHVALNDGQLVLKPFTVDAADGKISGEITIDAGDKSAVTAAELSFRELDLRKFFRDTQFVQEMGGRFAGALSLRGPGLSVAEIMANADGAVSVIFEDGTMSALVVEAIGLDLVEALALVIEGDARIALRCGRVDLAVQEGTAKIVQALIDTSDSVIFAVGSADFKQESLNVDVQASSKDFSLIDAAAPVSVSGPFRDPSIGIGAIDPLPFLEIGDQKDLDCARIIAGENMRQEIKEGQ